MPDFTSVLRLHAPAGVGGFWFEPEALLVLVPLKHPPGRLAHGQALVQLPRLVVVELLVVVVPELPATIER